MNTQELCNYDSVVVAKYIIAIANRQRIPINMTKVQKLLYIAYGIYLAVRGKRLTNEHPQAWPYGPVFPTTRNKLLKVDLYSINENDESLRQIKQDNDINSLLSLVFRTFGTWTAGQLTAWSHGDGTPWQRTVSSEGFDWGAQIPDEYIKSYFQHLISNE